MGWGSAGGYFDAVADALIEGGATDAVKTKVCSVLIGLFRGEGWDTYRDSLDQFADDPAIVEAFRKHEIYLSCDASDDEGLYDCALDDGHDGDHDDGDGHRWRDVSPGALLDDARALAKELFDRLRDFIPDDEAVFGDGLSWATLPEWLINDGTGRQLCSSTTGRGGSFGTTVPNPTARRAER